MTTVIETNSGIKPLAELDDPSRIPEIRGKITGKPGLRLLYEEIYQKYANCLARCPAHGHVVELGSGGGFAKRIIPELITSDTISYDGIDQVVDATAMPFADKSVRAIFMMNVFHHIPDVEAFFKEASRCLVPGGRVFIFDQNVGWISRPILKYAHHEPFDDKTPRWQFASSGPLSGANGALAWLVFSRDRLRLKREFPELELLRFETNTPLRYWLTGGLKNWSLLPGWAFGFFTAVDRLLSKFSQKLGSFVDVELVRK